MHLERDHDAIEPARAPIVKEPDALFFRLLYRCPGAWYRLP
jgi:hypothetical protein